MSCRVGTRDREGSEDGGDAAVTRTNTDVALAMMARKVAEGQCQPEQIAENLESCKLLSLPSLSIIHCYLFLGYHPIAA